MNKLTLHEKEALDYFINDIIPKLDEEGYNLKYIKFLFNAEDILALEKLFENNKKGIEILKRNSEEAKEENDNIYIKVNDCNRFARFLYKLTDFWLDNSKQYDFSLEELLLAIWLRMNVSDIDNLEEFLDKQKEFFKNDNFFDSGILNRINDYDLNYKVRSNKTMFETNYHLTFSLKKDNVTYMLPSIHYAIIDENDRKVCYIYGIQELEKSNKEKLSEILKDEKNGLRNKSVSQYHILSLKYFIDLLKERNIFDIRVPMFQVFDYSFHDAIGNSYLRSYNDYTEEEKENYDRMDINVYNPSLYTYLSTKKHYEQYYDKKDIISENKTERFLDTFIIMQEKFGNIEFLNEPMVQGDTLIIRIKKDKIISKRINE